MGMKQENPLIGFDLYNLKGINKAQEDLYQKLMEAIRVKVESGMALETGENELLEMENEMQGADSMASAGGFIRGAVITKDGLKIERID